MWFFSSHKKYKICIEHYLKAIYAAWWKKIELVSYSCLNNECYLGIHATQFKIIINVSVLNKNLVVINTKSVHTKFIFKITQIHKHDSSTFSIVFLLFYLNIYFYHILSIMYIQFKMFKI